MQRRGGTYILKLSGGAKRERLFTPGGLFLMRRQAAWRAPQSGISGLGATGGGVLAHPSPESQ
jgi:hypothetical protein